MISTFQHFLHDPVYEPEWAHRGAELEAWVLYRQMLLETSLRRNFPRLFSIEGRMQPVVDELVRAGVLRSAQPWEYAPASLPRTAYQFQQIVADDLRWATFPAVDGASVVAVCNTIVGTWPRPGYRVHPKTFAQLQAWDTTSSTIDDKYIDMMWAEEDWLSDLMIDIEILYYKSQKGL